MFLDTADDMGTAAACAIPQRPSLQVTPLTMCGEAALVLARHFAGESKLSLVLPLVFMDYLAMWVRDLKLREQGSRWC